MVGRPKLNDSRSIQYRVRLNNDENEKLNYVSRLTGKPKSAVFRDALSSYYNIVRLNEINEATDEDQWELDGISLKRVVSCPRCGSPIRIDLEEECSTTFSERQMGTETLYEFDFEDSCESCGERCHVSGYVSEYPTGALNHEDIAVIEA